MESDHEDENQVRNPTMETIQPIPPQCGDLPQSRGMVIESKDLESMILGEVAEVDRMAAEELARKAPLAGAD